MELDQERLKNQKDFREILEKYGISQAQAAILIKEESDRDVSIRTVRSWLANSTATSARPCPLWAVKSLTRATSNKPVIKEEKNINKS